MSEPTKAPETEQIFLVYLGSRISTKNTIIDFWLQVTKEQFKEGNLPAGVNDDLDGEIYRIYTSKDVKKRMGNSVGAVYEVPQIKGKTSIFSDKSRWQGLWPNEDHRMKWQLDHRTAITTMDVRKKAVKEGAEDNFAMFLPVKQKYRQLISQNQRAALLAQVIAYITG